MIINIIFFFVIKNIPPETNKVPIILIRLRDSLKIKYPNNKVNNITLGCIIGITSLNCICCNTSNKQIELIIVNNAPMM